MSMTGYGLARGDAGYVAELKAVNHKFLEIRVHLPIDLLALEPRITEFLRKRIKRGSLDVFVTRSGQTGSLRKPRLNMELAKRYIEIAGRLGEEAGLRNDLTAGALLALKDVVDYEVTVEDLDGVFTLLTPAVEKALLAFEQMRAKEGASIEESLRRYLDRIGEHVSAVAAEAPKALESHRERLKSRVSQVLGDIQPDSYRLEQEVLYHAERSDINEELERLASHLSQFGALFGCAETAGKKMDFIIQEMNREANTIASKTQSLPVSRLVIEIKTDLDRMREQVQNVE
ncbi:MAG: YicC family protein [Deltaproteobacteria bacterium]|nr:YicC family protein [Deltaproteobacteria bacterium]